MARISGAQVSILDGPNAGRTATATNGEYALVNLQLGAANVSAAASGYDEGRTAVIIQGATTVNFQLTDSAPMVQFAPGQHRVGVAVAAGRYFSDPGIGCYWERQSGTGGTAAETIAFQFIGFDAVQGVVDILPSDHTFQANAACGTWSSRSPQGAQADIRPGTWIVGAQVRPGTYRSSAGAGCFWERLGDFTRSTGSVIASEVIATAGTAFVTVSSGDVGFSADAACGTWTAEVAANNQAGRRRP